MVTEDGLTLDVGHTMQGTDSCIREMYTWNLYNLITQGQPPINLIHKKVTFLAWMTQSVLRKTHQVLGKIILPRCCLHFSTILLGDYFPGEVCIIDISSF